MTYRNPSITGASPGALRGIPSRALRGASVQTVLQRPEGYDPSELVQVLRPLDVARLVAHLGALDQEVSLVLALDQRKRVLAVHEAGRGGADSVPLARRTLVKVPLLVGARGVITVHNHPSGDAAPSKADVRIAQARAASLQCAGLELLDSMVIGAGRYESMRMMGVLPGARLSGGKYKWTKGNESPAEPAAAVRPNPTTTTAGGRVRETRLATLLRRRRGVIAAAITSRADGTAGMRFAMRDGDTIDVHAPNVPTAVRSITRYFVPPWFPDDVTVDGVSLRGHEAGLMQEYADKLARKDINRLQVRAVADAAAGAWIALGEQSALRVRDAFETAIRDLIYNVPANAMLHALAVKRFGRRAVSQVLDLGMKGGLFWRQTAAAYIDVDDDREPTLLYDVGRDRFMVTSVARWNAERRRGRR